MPQLKIGSLFSGYGGLDLAVAAFFNAEIAWHVEFDKAPSKILAHHYPDVPNLGDVTKINWSELEPVDILTGGYPCQPFSTAGKRKGANDERHLWPHVREAIRHLRPKFTILENVPGHLTLGFDRVLGDMAEDGLHVRWVRLPASAAGAPHQRERLFIVASPDPSSLGLEAERLPGRQEAQVPESADSERALAGAGGASDFDDDVRRWEGAHEAIRRWCGIVGDPPLVLEDRVTFHDEDIWGRAFPLVRPVLNPAFAEWMMGLPEGWVTSPEIGLSRAQQLKAIGNGVCPQQAQAALSVLVPRLQEGVLANAG